MAKWRGWRENPRRGGTAGGRASQGCNAIALGVLGSVIAAVAPARADGLSAQSGGFDCHLAAQIVEQQTGLPPGLLLAIGRVETGRTDPATGRVEPWAWSTDMGGVSHYFGTEAEAIDWTAAQLGGVQRSIDVGCFQINLMYHPQAFATLEQAFDPLLNARYAAQFLISLYRKTGSWQQAAEQYHSADPALGVPYGNRVVAFLTGGDQPVASFTPVSYSSRTENTWVRTGPASFGIQVFVPSWAKRSQTVSAGGAVSQTSSGGVLVMMPIAANQVAANQIGSDTRSIAPPAQPHVGGGRMQTRSAERNLPHVYTPGAP